MLGGKYSGRWNNSSNISAPPPKPNGSDLTTGNNKSSNFEDVVQSVWAGFVILGVGLSALSRLVGLTPRLSRLDPLDNVRVSRFVSKIF